MPTDFQHWLQQQAAAQRRSVDQEVILRQPASGGDADGSSDAELRLARIRGIAARTAGMTVLDVRPEADIRGLGGDGLPG